MDDNYYLSHGPLHEYNRMPSETNSNSSNYLSYSLPQFPTEKLPKKVHGIVRQSQQHHRMKTSSSKTKTQITEKEAKEAIMRGLITETNDIDVTKLSGKSKFLFLIIYIYMNLLLYKLSSGTSTLSQQGRRFGADVKPPCKKKHCVFNCLQLFVFYLDSYIALITLAIESSKDGKMTLNGM